MLVFLWIAAALCHVVSSNAIFKGHIPGDQSRDVVYKIGDISNSNTTTPQNIKEGFAFLQENTCVNFIDSADAPGREINLVVRNPPESATFPRGPNAYCMIAKVEGKATFVIGNCIRSRYFIIHEASHFLGLCHTQERSDWRDYVKILPNDKVSTFDTPECESVPDVKYDYGSGMHHDLYPVATPTDEAYVHTMGQSVRFPFSDYRTINWLFNCDGKCNPKPNCQNGGYTHPRDCTKCMCNKYYTGDLCETPRNLIKLSCAAKPQHVWSIQYIGNATLKPKLVLTDDFRNRGENHWDLIEAPQNMKMQVEVEAVASKYGTTLACGPFAVEINDGDLNLVGRMFCDDPNVRPRIVHNFTARSQKVGLHAEYPLEATAVLKATFTLLGCDGKTG